MSINDTIASCSGLMSTETAWILGVVGLNIFVVVSLIYLHGGFEQTSARKKPHQLRPRQPSGAHHCENAAWRNLLSSKPDDEVQW